MGTDSTKKPFKVRSQARRGNVQCATELNNFFNCLTVRLITLAKQQLDRLWSWQPSVACALIA